ncbi:Clp protease N-terminal domain-containing protein [Amycolatopsis mongoliensis]|uniref:Clp protease N-terminal domain-containing protein n=1 Tax=Amycolatopsis mongoliensis TaxID=715475 RepID=A0A9Y2NK65_9PSEU|nr:Clp protease N-terminal domain-containing protein [Amycolatopsis sp. 4-36]WIY00810.1 Clp protease N-terminal domain-containing protein [Amycolatopsis sp. 4-36]
MRNPQFDDDVRALVRTAQERARALGHPGIGCEHLLYAIAHSPTPLGEVAREHGVTPERVAAQTDRLLNGPRSVFDGLDADALATIGIDLQAVREAVEATFGPAPVPRPRHRRRHRVRLPGHLPVTGRARSCLDTAVKDAEQGGTRVAEHHIGAAVVTADGGLVPPILAALGVSAPQLRRAILARAGR